MSKPAARRILCVSWHDSFTPSEDDSWKDIDDIVDSIREHGGVAITTVGALIFENDSLVALAGSHHDNRACGVMCIPKVCIVAREDLA